VIKVNSLLKSKERRVRLIWIQTAPTKGSNTLLRFYSPTEAFFTKEWQPSEIELVK
jgi:hypothetical protein